MIEQILQCKDYDPKKMKYPCSGQVKMNGIFGRWCRDKGHLYTRTWNRIYGLDILEWELKDFEDFDGELIVPNIEFFKMNGLLRRRVSKPNTMFYVFDKPEEHPLWRIRSQKYMSILRVHPRKHIHPLKSHFIRNEAEADAFYKRVVEAGHEGVVYKFQNGKYYDGKRWDVQKRVPLKSGEGTIIGFQEGKKSFEGLLGAFLIDFEGVEVKVGGGPGMSHEMRKKIWNNKEKYLGKKLTVSYKAKTPTGSLQSPKYKAIRWDI